MLYTIIDSLIKKTIYLIKHLVTKKVTKTVDYLVFVKNGRSVLNSVVRYLKLKTAKKPLSINLKTFSISLLIFFFSYKYHHKHTAY